MNATEIREYAKLMKELELTGLEITDADQTVRLERNVAVSYTAAPIQAAGTAQEPSTAEHTVTASDTVAVKSPIVGVFYAAPAADAAPYVAVGDAVKKGQTLCIVEAMKLMNEITAEEDGTIVEVCVADGQMIEYGTVLFKVRRQTNAE